MVTGVWVGNDDNTKMGNLTGGTVPALIWKDVMKVATEPYGNNDFDYPEVKLKAFHAKMAPVIISPENAQKTFEKEENEAEKESTEAMQAEDNTDFEASEQNTPAPAVVKTQAPQQKVETKKAAPKVEVKPVKIEPPKNESEARLAPIPMAKPFQ